MTVFHKVRLRLTLLCFGIAALIITVLSSAFLYVSEKSLRENRSASFSSDMSTLTANLEQQSVITHEWLSRMEQNGKYLIFLFDGETPFLYNSLVRSPQEAVLCQEALDSSSGRSSVEKASSYLSSHREFLFTSPTLGQNYQACIASLNKNGSLLQAVVLSPLSNLERQLLLQRLFLILSASAAILLLTVFSWFFTGSLLSPIRKNQQRQAEFISAASHELRTPLAVILSAVSASKNAPEEDREAFLSTIAAESSRMSRLVDDMLTLSRADSLTWDIRPGETDMDTLVLDCYEAFESLAREKDLCLSVSLPPESLPPCRCDKDRISQVVFILLHNAVSYTPAGGKVSLALSLDSKGFLIQVADTGPGIPDDQKSLIFDRFYRADPSRTDRSHFGLGLSVASEIARLHRGRLSVGDNPGGGAVFSLRLPQKVERG